MKCPVPYFRLISALLLWWALGSSSTLAVDLPELRFEMSGDALFIGVGSHKTYRRYYHYLSTPEGCHTLFNSLVTGYLTLFVDFHAALWVSHLFSSPRVKSILFPSVLLLLPPTVRSVASWLLQQRLQQEQIRVNNERIKDLFFIEMLYDLAPDQQALEIRPIPESMTHHPLSDSDSVRNSSLWLWQELYKSLQYHQVSSVRLSWYENEESREILVALQSINSQEPSYHPIEVFSDDLLPVSVESVLHNEWQPAALLEHSGSSQPVISLLKDEVIALVTAVINDPLATIPAIPLESLVTYLQPDNNAMGFTASLCHQDHPACNTSLQLIWQAFPYPHYRPKLFFDNLPQCNPQRQIIHNTAEQLADCNLAELMMQTLESLLVMVTSASFQHLPDIRLQPFEPTGFKVMVSELQETLAHAPSTEIRAKISSFNLVQWRAILLNMHQQSTPDSMQTICQRLTNQQFDWQGLFLGENGEASADQPPCSTLTGVFQSLPSQEQNAVLNSMLAKSPGDFIDTLQSIPGDTAVSWLADAVSKQNSDSISACLHNLNNQQLETFVNTLLEKYAGRLTWSNSIISLIKILPEHGKTILVSPCASASSGKLSTLFYRLLTGEPEIMARILTRDRTRYELDNTLSEVLSTEYEQDTEESRRILKALLPLMTVETFKQAWSFRREVIAFWNREYRSPFLESMIKLLRKTQHLGDPAAVELFSHFNSEQKDIKLVQAMLDDASENLPQDSDYRDNLFASMTAPGAVSGILAPIIGSHTHGYMAYLLKLRHKNEPRASDLIREVNSYKRAKYLAERLVYFPGLSDDDIQFIMRNANSRRPFSEVIVNYPVLMSSEHRRHFVELLPDTLWYIIRKQEDGVLLSLIDWLANLPEAQLKDVIKKTATYLSLPNLAWWTSALNSLVNHYKISASLAGLMLANTIHRHPFYKPEMLIPEMDKLLGTYFAIEISEMDGHSALLLHSLFKGMDSENLAYYLAELTKHPDLWQSHNQDVVIAATQINKRQQLPMVVEFNPDMQRYEEMSSRLDKRPQPQPVSHDIAKHLQCMICLSQYQIPATIHNACGITFCKKCLQDLQHAVEGEQRSLTCPACRGLIDLEKDFTRNRAVEDLIGNGF